MGQVMVLVAGEGFVLEPLRSSRLRLRFVFDQRQPLAGLVSFALARP
jgi:hypothetical protein